MDSLRDFLSEMGSGLGGGDKPTTVIIKQYSSRSRSARSARTSDQLIRSMMEAAYSLENCGHLSNFSKYTHFTLRYVGILICSFIERFVLIHNRKSVSLKAHPEQKTLSRADVYPYEFAELDRLGELCSSAERQADAVIALWTGLNASTCKTVLVTNLEAR